MSSSQQAQQLLFESRSLYQSKAALAKGKWRAVNLPEPNPKSRLAYVGPTQLHYHHHDFDEHLLHPTDDSDLADPFSDAYNLTNPYSFDRERPSPRLSAVSPFRDDAVDLISITSDSLIRQASPPPLLEAVDSSNNFELKSKGKKDKSKKLKKSRRVASPDPVSRFSLITTGSAATSHKTKTSNRTSKTKSTYKVDSASFKSGSNGSNSAASKKSKDSKGSNGAKSSHKGSSKSGSSTTTVGDLVAFFRHFLPFQSGKSNYVKIQDVVIPTSQICVRKSGVRFLQNLPPDQYKYLEWILQEVYTKNGVKNLGRLEEIDDILQAALRGQIKTAKRPWNSGNRESYVEHVASIYAKLFRKLATYENAPVCRKNYMKKLGEKVKATKRNDKKRERKIVENGKIVAVVEEDAESEEEIEEKKHETEPGMELEGRRPRCEVPNQIMEFF